ncbi:homeobox protein HAT3.1 isoform X1 [Punica granatum]|uniref:Homeobox protein HAT3.1 isoform X1 n=2 Tax=Punica granatum TaxID=22663 RepID=A0A6P8DI96_PUNGR|nr:homeobox protein HAT3.1 isoform X1 [Punica granatum]XP_031391203.1 homeobox protein HAT3.1 isoform X1 [Punica granatum]
MTGNEEGKKQKPEIVSETLEAGHNQQAASAIPLGNAAHFSPNVQTNAARKAMIKDAHELNSADMVTLQEERDQLASEGPGTVQVGSVVNERLHGPSENVATNSPLEGIIPIPEGMGGSNPTGNRSCHIYAQLNENIGCCSDSLSHEPSKTFQNLTDPLISQELNLAVKAEPICEVVEICPEDGTNCLVTEQFELPVEVISNLDHLETPAGNPAKNIVRSGRRDKRNSTRMKKKYILRSSLGNNSKALRSRAGKKSKSLESDYQSGDTTAPEESKRIRRKKQRTRKVTADEYTRIKKNLSYMLNRIRYERSLIDAYSSEGWKGLSLEKLKPEKELQRATSEIIRRKLKIRDLFQRLDAMCAEGRLPEALFDEEGMISSEDIFCAKCGSKDLTLDNDIILCDGACQRGFHQFCLDPPLLKEDIPPGDQGWLCPGCDCKVDCLDLLNESQETNLSITDSWEKVFPEAVKAGNQDPTSGLSSDDSEDEDFDPDRLQTNRKVQGDESSSDESEYATASDNSEPQAKDNQYLGLPSDDSEDDDYDPDAPNPDKVKEENSSSDFTSDSEDLKAALLDDDPNGSNGVPESSSLKGRRGPKRKNSEGGGKKQAINELHSLLESEPGESGAATSVSAKRHVERLDYKKLHDETYGGTSSDTSDDEDWTDTSSPKKRKRNGEDEKQQKEEISVSINKTRSRRKSEDTSTPSATKPSAKNQSSSSRRLGEAVKKRLYEAFNLNHYPDRATKESLAAELGITCLQVDKWFGNARWCFNHPSGRKAKVPAKDDNKDTTHLPQAVMKSNEEILSNGTQKEGNPGVTASIPGSSEKEDEREKKLSEPREEFNNREGSTVGNKKYKASKAPMAVGQASGIQTRRSAS